MKIGIMERLPAFIRLTPIRLRFGSGKDYVMVKRRTLMARYGYKKLTPALAEHFNRCIYFYEYMRNGLKCQFECVGIDKMTMFKAV